MYVAVMPLTLSLKWKSSNSSLGWICSKWLAASFRVGDGGADASLMQLGSSLFIRIGLILASFPRFFAWKYSFCCGVYFLATLFIWSNLPTSCNGYIISGLTIISRLHAPIEWSRLSSLQSACARHAYF